MYNRKFDIFLMKTDRCFGHSKKEPARMLTEKRMVDARFIVALYPQQECHAIHARTRVVVLGPVTAAMVRRRGSTKCSAYSCKARGVVRQRSNSNQTAAWSRSGPSNLKTP
jgi:hypothetical protein